MRTPIERGEACGAVVHRPSMGGTPTDRCPCSRMWWGAPEDDPYEQPAPPPPTSDSITATAVIQSWWENHHDRWDDLAAEITRTLEPYLLHGPGFEPAFGPYTTPALGFAAPRVRLLCPRGHLVDDVVVVLEWDGDSSDQRERWRLRSALKLSEAQYQEGLGLRVAAPLHEQPQGPWDVVGLRNRARCRNPKCKYDGRPKLEYLLKLYCLAVRTGTRQVPIE